MNTCYECGSPHASITITEKRIAQDLKEKLTYAHSISKAYCKKCYKQQPNELDEDEIKRTKYKIMINQIRNRKS